MQVHHRVVPPTLHVNETNARIALGSVAVPLRVAKQAEALAPAGGALRIIAGVSSFGFGGTNAHAIVASVVDDDSADAFPAVAVRGVATATTAPPTSALLLLSAKSDLALDKLKVCDHD